MKAFARVAEGISMLLGRISAVVTFLMMLLMIVDIVMRFAFNSPIIGSFELIEQMMVVVVFFAFAHTQRRKGHIGVDIVTSILPKKVKAAFSVFTYLLGTIMMGIVAYATFTQIISSKADNFTTSTLFIPLYPFVAVVFIGILVFFFTMLFDLILEIAILSGREDLVQESNNTSNTIM